MKVLFVHGAGGFDDDRPIADGLAARLGVDVDYLELPTEDMSFEAWGRVIEPGLAALSGDDVVVAHSFGASALLPLLQAGVGSPARAVLLGMPDWGPDGWDVEEYAFNGAEPSVSLSIHHCRDDEVASFELTALHRVNFPNATFYEHDTGGHQFVGRTDEIVVDLRGA